MALTPEGVGKEMKIMAKMRKTQIRNEYTGEILEMLAHRGRIRRETLKMLKWNRTDGVECTVGHSVIPDGKDKGTRIIQITPKDSRKMWYLCLIPCDENPGTVI